MPPYLPIRALNRSQGLRIGKVGSVKPSATATTYVDLADGDARKDLARHSSIGAIYAVGPITNTNLDHVVDTGGVVTNGSGLSVNVTAGEFRQRSTGVWTNGLAATNFALTAADGTQDRTDLIHWDQTTGAVGKTDGALAPAGTSVAPARPAGKTALATVLVAATATTPGTKTDVRPRP